MRDRVLRPLTMRVGASLIAVGLALALSGCSLDEVEPPPLGGPSDIAVSVQLQAKPDVLNADGVSQAVVELVVRDNSGAPLSNKAVEFSFSGDGKLLPSADSIFVGPVQTALVMATDNDGVARVVYVAGTQIRDVTILVRPYGFDAYDAFSRIVVIRQI
jgi:hypothetical protein